jgi:diguanylate cyclase (GGDEF)-like protein
MIDSHVYYEAHFNDTDLMVAIISNDKTLITANPRLLEFSGARLEDIAGMPYYDLPWWSHSSALMNKVIFHIEDCLHGNKSFFISTHMSCSNELHEIDFRLKPVFDDDNEILFIVATGYDVTEVLMQREKTTTREKLFQALFENSSDGYFFIVLEDSIALDMIESRSGCSDDMLSSIIDHLRVDKYNDSFKAIIGTEKCDMKSVSMCLGLDDAILHERLKKAIRSGFCSFSSDIVSSSDGSTKHLHTTLISIILSDRFAGIFAIVKDETQNIVYLNEMKHFAQKDYLTGLNNRRRFFELASGRFQETSRSGVVMSVAMLDIDHFKSINDTYGHDAGDKVLRDIAGIIDEHTRQAGISARYGGEEFVSLVDMDEELAASMFDDIRRVIESTVILYGNMEISVTASIGVSQVMPADAVIDNSISRADMALYESKRNGRNRSTIFNSDVHVI